ncbi:hypothetical protein CA13_23150 [Planctomycetes bacterium CA13]|uniref:DUF1571 domain-containing protein n=2 Tax=Novipirellula herctigrandis TaxID=2527986 RepID=A0A5C5Z0P3_9BACT|nr:hypothetical protein CA13_23150 [Planctomycetes bacterium CA13]
MVAMRSPGNATSESISTVERLSDNLRLESVETDTRASSIAEVLEIARAARVAMAGNLKDYTARFVKQEVDTSGLLGETTEMNVKVQTRLRDGSDNAPMRVYLGFESPESVRGREVIWAKDLHDGQLVVHEAGLLGMITLRLDPTGMLAMRGQRYPIYEIGLVRLVEKLIERGGKDLDNPDIQVTITKEVPFDDVSAELIQVKRSKPSDEEDDFSLAEIVMDPNRQLVLSYRSFGWPADEGEKPPLQESYAYHDIQTNVGLAETDFDPQNSAYQFP